MKGDGDPKSSLTVVVGIVGVIVMLAIVIFAQVLFYNVQRVEDQRKVYAPRPQELADLQAQQRAQINTIRFVDEKAGLVAIPIDRAIELYVAKMKSASAPTTMNATGDQNRPHESNEGP